MNTQTSILGIRRHQAAAMLGFSIALRLLGL
jgi:hypothetical protein